MFAGCVSLLAEWGSPEETVCGMDAASEPTGMYSRRVSEGDTHCKAQQALFRPKGSRASAGLNASAVSAKTALPAAFNKRVISVGIKYLGSYI